MSNPAADYPASLHTNTDTSGFGNTGLGLTTPTHSAVHGKIEEEIRAIQTKLGIGAAPASTASSGEALVADGAGSTSWEAVATVAQDILEAAYDPNLVGTITRNSDYAVTAGTALWPDGTTGAFTTLVLSTEFPGAIDSYSVVHGSDTYTQPTMTRDDNGAVIVRPQIVIT